MSGCPLCHTRDLPDDDITWPNPSRRLHDPNISRRPSEPFPKISRTLSKDVPNPFRRFPNPSRTLPKDFRRSPEDVPTMSRDPPLMRCNFNEMRNPTANHSAPFGQNERIRLLVLFLSMSYTLVSQKKHFWIKTITTTYLKRMQTSQKAKRPSKLDQSATFWTETLFLFLWYGCNEKKRYYEEIFII